MTFFYYLLAGAKYKDECPVESMVPFYLIVMGTVGIIANCYTCCIKYAESGDGEEKKINPYQAVVQLIIFAWIICGNVMIRKNYEPNYNDPSSSDFCNKTLYLFAFWVTTSYYILFGVVSITLLVINFAGTQFRDFGETLFRGVSFSRFQ